MENPYPAYFKEIADAQDERKKSLEARTAAVVGVSGALVTLLLAFAGLGTKAEQSFKLTDDARWYLYAALICFVASSIIAVLGAFPLLYRTMQADGLRWVAENAWNEPAEDAARRVGFTRVASLGWNKRMNDIKATILALAVGVQIAAIVFVAIAAWEILTVAPVTRTPGS